MPVYDRTTVVNTRSTQRAYVTVSRSGVWTLNMEACKRLHVAEGTRVHVEQDENDPRNWWLVVREANGFTVRKRQDGLGGAHCFNCVEAARDLFACIGYTGNSGRMLIGEGQDSRWTIITNSCRAPRDTKA